MLLFDWLSSRHFVIDMKQLYIQKKGLHNNPSPVYRISSIKKGKKKHKTHWKMLVSLPGIELGASGVVLRCTNLINITSTIQQQSYFSKKG